MRPVAQAVDSRWRYDFLGMYRYSMPVRFSRDMADTISPEARSRVMSRVRGRNTAPELHVRRAVWAEGFRYRLHVRKLPGTPDLALAKYRLAVFVHGCFWHQHDGCRNAKRPSSNREYWDKKLDGNAARDARHRIQLEESGWAVATIWECSLKSDTESLLERLKNMRKDNALRAYQDISYQVC